MSKSARRHVCEPPDDTFGPLGMARDHEDDDQRCDRAEASDRGSGIHGRKQTRVVRHDLRIGQHDDPREKQKHQQQIEQALDHDRRERRGRAELLAPGQHVRSQDLADASRHEGVRRESHHGCAERVVESRVPMGANRCRQRSTRTDTH